MNTFPDDWSDERRYAFNRLMDVVGELELYSAILTRFNINDAFYTARRNELRDLVINVLAPAFKAAP